ncbi:DMT family transporter [Asticcacaulis sp. BYS171W]|uniref:DMT family transporter n=1 Tax=Asticcacaulis aquaticus TaxID=2984212 RepID=A0ABT5HS85_9CAUL|nr:DMT family transporter [Asticcacaulis aquaticus]MDC7682937.1 DMT family transporter [Asticcacaulis aquaticus]
MPRHNALPVVSVLSLLVAMASVQIGATFAKHLFSDVGPMATVALRQGFAAIILLAVFRPWREGLWPTGCRWRTLALYGIVLGVMNLVFYAAIARIPLGIAVAIEFIGPLAVALMGSRQKLDFVWISLAIAGLWTLLPQGDAAHLDPLGVLFALIAGVCWGAYILLGQKVGSQMPGGVAVSLGIVISCVLTVPVGLGTATAALFTWPILLMGLGVALLSGAIPFTIEMFALKQIPAKTFGILMSLEPAVAALSGLVLLHEFLTGRQWLAIALIIAASAGATLMVRKPAATPDPA